MTTSEAVEAIGKYIYGILAELTHADQPGILTTIEINGVRFRLTIEQEEE